MEKNKVTLSVALATYNEEDVLAKCLESIASWVDEIVIVDGGSKDKTVEIAQRYKAKVISTDNPPIFHINKQKAVDACKKDWILQLDADEIISTPLKEEILVSIDDDTKPYIGYYIPRKNFFLGIWMKKGGQYPDYVIRLFERGKGKFPSRSVHEQVTISGDVGYLKNPLLHYPYETFSEYWEKALRYSKLVARELAKQRAPKNIITAFSFFIVKPLYTFMNLFIRHRGIMDGGVGFLFAFFSALQHPIAYIEYVYGKNIN